MIEIGTPCPCAGEHADCSCFGSGEILQLVTLAEFRALVAGLEKEGPIRGAFVPRHANPQQHGSGP